MASKTRNVNDDNTKIEEMKRKSIWQFSQQAFQEKCRKILITNCNM